MTYRTIPEFALISVIWCLTVPVSATTNQSLAAGCYKLEESVCRIHVQPFEIQVDETVDERAAEFALFASNTVTGNAVELWRFATDATFNEKPIGDYSPPLPKADFPAQCGETYVVTIETRGNTSDTEGTLATTGSSGEFTCPE